MTNRKPVLKQYTDFENGGKVILASDLPPAILNATKEELAALAVFAEAMPELLEGAYQATRAAGEPITAFQFYETEHAAKVLLVEVMDAALEAAKSTTAEEGK